MKLLKSHVDYGQDGNRSTADLYETESGFEVHINIEVGEIHTAHIVLSDNDLSIWKEIVE